MVLRLCLAKLEEEAATRGGEVARELWEKRFRSFGQRSKGGSLFLGKVTCARRVACALVVPLAEGCVSVCRA